MRHAPSSAPSLPRQIAHSLRQITPCCQVKTGCQHYEYRHNECSERHVPTLKWTESIIITSSIQGRYLAINISKCTYIERACLYTRLCVYCILYTVYINNVYMCFPHVLGHVLLCLQISFPVDMPKHVHWHGSRSLYVDSEYYIIYSCSQMNAKPNK